MKETYIVALRSLQAKLSEDELALYYLQVLEDRLNFLEEELKFADCKDILGGNYLDNLYD